MVIVTYLLHTRTYYVRFSLQDLTLFDNHGSILKGENMMTCFFFVNQSGEVTEG